nr:MAG TPA: hypothetical protein [Caudoviricetes sp.]
MNSIIVIKKNNKIIKVFYYKLIKNSLVQEFLI